jgi:apolipoprotein N-acyltransferase
VFPLLRAAGISGWWVLAFFVPVLNLVPLVLWPLKIAKARGKSVWVGVLLLVPVINLFAFLYLAFSDGAPGTDDQEPEPKVMFLQTI